MFKTKSMFVAAFVSIALVAGCGKNKAVKAAEDLADAVCACKDAACAATESKKGMDALMALANESGTESDAKAITDAMERMQTCTAKLTK